MALLKMVGGVDIELSREDTVRLQNMVRKSGMSIRALDSGIIVNMDNVALIMPEPDEGQNMGRPQIEKAAQEDQPEETPEPDEPKLEKPRLHVGQLKAILDASGLSQGEFANSIGYSEATLRMALKEARISQAFSDAVVAKYLPETEAESPPDEE